ncbi:MAG: hypothetical protein JWO86_4716 [Myxococcaceae bacterium]|jgi:hypothetical protein|nr:hypothetical protein [Myxococcaceae bacterium]MEA2752171.1 hypothetical protein [Myxococcales bacterium]
MLRFAGNLRKIAFAAILPALAASALGSGGCGPMAGPGAKTRPLPSYAGRAADLFDDSIDPAGVGMDFDKGYTPKADPMLRERAQVSDAVLRVKVSTVTGKKDGPESTYQLDLHTVEKMTGANPPPPDFTVTVNKASEAHGIVKNFEGRLVGYPFIAFVREFVRPDGDHEVHFHLSPDTTDVKSAVANAVILGEAGAPQKQ